MLNKEKTLEKALMKDIKELCHRISNEVEEIAKKHKVSFVTVMCIVVDALNHALDYTMGKRLHSFLQALTKGVDR